MMWPELIACIAKKAVEDVEKERDALRAELAHTVARNIELEKKRVLLETDVDRLAERLRYSGPQP